MKCSQLLVLFAACHWAQAYEWVNITSATPSLPAGAFEAGTAAVGFHSEKSPLWVCRASNAWATSGATDYTPGHLALYDNTSSQAGYNCAFCMASPGFCYLYDPEFQAT